MKLLVIPEGKELSQEAIDVIKQELGVDQPEFVEADQNMFQQRWVRFDIVTLPSTTSDQDWIHGTGWFRTNHLLQSIRDGNRLFSLYSSSAGFSWIRIYEDLVYIVHDNYQGVFYLTMPLSRFIERLEYSPQSYKVDILAFFCNQVFAVDWSKRMKKSLLDSIGWKK